MSRHCFLCGNGLRPVYDFKGDFAQLCYYECVKCYDRYTLDQVDDMDYSSRLFDDDPPGTPLD